MRRRIAIGLALSMGAAYPAPVLPGPNTSMPGKKLSQPKKFRNMPEVKIAPPGALHWQEETNVFADTFVTNTTVDHGFPGGWNIGFSVLNAPLYHPGGTFFDPELFLNIEKAFLLLPRFALVLGTQAGTNPLHKALPLSFASYTYCNGQVDLSDWGLRAHGGGYYANHAVSGTHGALGYVIGLEAPLPTLGFSVVAEHVSGRNALSASLIEIVIPVSRRWELGIGLQIPNPHSDNDYAGLLELNSR